jgi:putative oxidoreductase
MKLFFFDCGTRDPLASTGVLILRACTGLMMLFGHGLAKWQNFEKLKASWVAPEIWPLSYMSSPISLVATISAEFFAAALIVLGLATRPAAFVLGFAMCVAAFQVHAHDPWLTPAGGGKAKEMALLYLVPCFVIIITGAGQWSLDSFVHTERRRRRR